MKTAKVTRSSLAAFCAARTPRAHAREVTAYAVTSRHGLWLIYPELFLALVFVLVR
jgi:hypothetical protein